MSDWGKVTFGPCAVHGCDRQSITKAYGYCGPHHHRFKRHGDPLAGRRLDARDLADRLTRYEVDPETGCWVWQAGLSDTGYGSITLEPGCRGAAHRASYEFHVGPIPAGLYVCHHCDNRRCINPSHLFLGTAKDNAQDMAHKGRSTRGERSAQALLTTEQARAIKGGAKSVQELATEYGVSVNTIYGVQAGRAWTHLDTPEHASRRRWRQACCPRGHLLAEPNIVPSAAADGRRVCRSCATARARAHKKGFGGSPLAAAYIQALSDVAYFSRWTPAEEGL